jgi:hypothetical protein
MKRVGRNLGYSMRCHREDRTRTCPCRRSSVIRSPRDPVSRSRSRKTKHLPAWSYSIESDRTLASRAASDKVLDERSRREHRPGQGRLLSVGWARRCRAARACQKSAKILRRRGNIRRNQPRDVTEFKASNQQANSRPSNLSFHQKQSDREGAGGHKNRDLEKSP